MSYDRFTDNDALLWAAFKASPTDENRDRLVERFMPLVRRAAKRILARMPEGLELDTLISAGTSGLRNAITTYDVVCDTRFERYCISQVRGAILDKLQSMTWTPQIKRYKILVKQNEGTDL